MGRKLVNLVGRKFDRLTVICRVENAIDGAVRWLCKCDCGKEVVHRSGTLKKRTVRSCGCFRKAYRKRRATTHGQYGTSRYWMWKSAKNRAKKKGLPFSMTIYDIPDIPDLCPVLGIELSSGYGVGGVTYNSPTLDRIVPSRGYVPGNLQIISQRANVIKNDASPEEVMLVAKYMTEFQ